MKIMKSRVLVFVGFLLCLFACTVSATTLSGDLTADNSFWAYLSTDDSVQGIEIGFGNTWQAAFSLTETELIAGVDYYLHIYVYDYDGPEGLLGDFTLSGSDHIFSDGSSYLLTGNTSDWHGNNTGWGETDVAIAEYGTKGTNPWHFALQPSYSDLDPNAQWIWPGTTSTTADSAWFSTKIFATTSNAVPEPTTIALLGLGLLSIAGVSRREK